MIKLVIEEYCHDCPSFNATNDTSVIFGDDGTCIVENRVTCVYREECGRIKKFLEKKVTKDE